MKKLTIIFALMILFINYSIAQNVKPIFEKQNGLTKATYFFDDGKIKETGYFNNDKLQGKWISYNEKGEIIVIANYKNGKKIGKWFVVSNDTIKELNYKNNKLTKVKNSAKTQLSMI